MKPLLTIKVFPNCMRLPRFLKIREQFAGINCQSRKLLLDKVSKGVAEKENCKPEEILSWIENAFYPCFVSIMKYQRNGRNGINEILGTLQQSGIKLGVLSDYDFVNERLTNLKIDTKHFSITASSEASGALKPSPIPFLNIARMWNFPPEQILVIGDRDDTDGKAAEAAGMKFCKIIDKVESDTTGYSWECIKELLIRFK